ncbi:MAG TPA: biliverdin-producing heme oxygenase [Anaeromyxobacteraceae bacterium]|nr:biliverdin-producing heme oxygenase [Anaeromyxobacteraceae bacterium]
MTSHVLEQLRSATRPLHAPLEAAVALDRPDLRVDHYRGYLSRLLGWHAPLEEALARAPEVPGADVPSRRKASLLADDLVALGLSPAEVAALPRCRALPAVDTAARLLGVLYVVEGATLGGCHVLRLIAARLPGEVARASRFLRCYGDGRATGERFRAFAALLERATPPGAAGEAACAARDAFRSLHAWFTASEAPTSF